jgi:dTDP-4-dehydrorhamnose reductase
MPNAVLIVGVDSKIGSALYQSYLRDGYSAFATTRRKSVVNDSVYYLDLSSVQYQLEILPKVDIVFLCAYITSMSECKTVSYSEKVNVDGISSLARFFLNQGSYVVFLSSNAVFNRQQNRAKECTVPIPRTIYGWQKYKAENQLLKLATEGVAPKLAIVRLTKVLTQDLVLLQNWRNKIYAGEKISAYENLSICPISLPFVVSSLKKIGKSRESGIFHLGGKYEYSYLEIGRAITKVIGGRSAQVINTRAPDSQEGLLNSVSLDMSDTNRLFGIQPENYFSSKGNILDSLKK